MKDHIGMLGFADERRYGVVRLPILEVMPKVTQRVVEIATWWKHRTVVKVAEWQDSSSDRSGNFFSTAPCNFISLPFCAPYISIPLSQRLGVQFPWCLYPATSSMV